jgi:4-hydroxy-tetrahydrodipicolinate synthase
MTNTTESTALRPAQGVWLPLITPFRDGDLDIASLERLVRHYRRQPIDGMILAATTGEGMTLDPDEVNRLVETVTETLDGQMPVYLGLSGSDTRKVAAAVGQSGRLRIDGYLVACPYYTRPGQDGLYRHFEAVGEAADRPVLIYNIPYRTGVNLANDTLLGLAELPNIAGLKDCCADMGQTFDLLCRRPAGFSVLTGEDALYYGAIAHGADGGILASAHIETASFAHVRNCLLAGDQPAALAAWRRLSFVPRLLFAEPSPSPIKYWLWRAGLIESPEVRLPMTEVSAGLASRIDGEVERQKAA